MRPQLTADLALGAHPELFDRIGWDNLRQARVNLFAVLTEEAERDALAMLPSRLAAKGAGRPGPLPRPTSAFDVSEPNLINELVRWAAERRSFPLCDSDHLLLCAKEYIAIPCPPGIAE